MLHSPVLPYQLGQPLRRQVSTTVATTTGAGVWPAAAFVKTEQLVLDHLDESFAIRGLDLLLCKTVDVADCLWLAQIFAHHRFLSH